jgi:hypothetical protein
MALTITVLNATQDMLRLSAFSGGEGGDTAQLSQASLVALCVPGPLKSLLTAPLFEGPPGPGVAAWANLIEDARLSVYASGIGGNSNGVAYNFTTDSSVNHFDMATGGSGTAVFELNFRHSINR